MARLAESQLSDNRKLESKWEGVVLLAYEEPPELANLSSEQLRKLQKLEKELGVCLIAYKLQEFDTEALYTGFFAAENVICCFHKTAEVATFFLYLPRFMNGTAMLQSQCLREVV